MPPYPMSNTSLEYTMTRRLSAGKKDLVLCVDSHTAGEPTRVIVNPPFLKGKSVRDMRDDFRTNYDYLRLLMMNEPRGHKDMFGSVVCWVRPELQYAGPVAGPCFGGDAFGLSTEIDAKIFFMDGDGYLDMCGHGTIGTVTVLIESGMINKTPDADNIVRLLIEAPAGLITVNATVIDNSVRSVSFENVPSFYLTTVHVPFEYDDHHVQLEVDVCYGGNYFGLVTMQQLPWISMDTDHAGYLGAMGNKMRAVINDALAASGFTERISLVEICDEEAQPSPRNVVIFGGCQVDRSPCGTGTSAKLAFLYHSHRIQIGDVYHYRSICDTEFLGQVVREATAPGGHPGVIPRITGSAYITGWSHFMLSTLDPFKNGLALH